MPIAAAALLLLLSSHASAGTPWTMEAGLWRNVIHEPSGYGSRSSTRTVPFHSS